MKDMLYTLFTSKKAWATITAIVVWIVGRFGADVPAEDLLPLVAALLTFVAGQALADTGKEKAKVERDAGLIEDELE